jgi:membrane peptidoglycan carboxypeptidase
VAGKRKAGSGPSGPAKRAPAKKAAAAQGPVKRGRNGKPKKQRSTKAKVRRALFVVLLGFLVLILGGVGAFAVLYNTIDLPDPNADFETETSYVYYDGGSDEIGRYAIQNRDAISYDEMPEVMKQAVVAAENRSFWTDSGIDVKGIVRAAFSNASGNSTQGASTITQQYIKVLYLTQERSYTRKVKEAVLSLKLQRKMDKEQILEGYLNTIYFGRGAYGVQAAAQTYYGVPAADLTLKQAAALSAIINNPSGFNPDSKDGKKRLRERYQYVLNGMASAGNITTEDAEKAGKRLPKFPDVETESTYGGQKGHQLTMVKDALLKLRNAETGQPFTESEIDGGGLRITTTFTKKAMDAAEQGVAAERPEGDEFSDKDLHVAAASVEPGTGAVRGFYAGQDYLDSQLNWAVAGGQAGSSLKPFALAAGLKAGYSLKDTFDGNSPFELEDGTEIENQGDKDYGSAVNLLTATEDSINTAFVDLTTSIPDGPTKVMQMMNAMGIPRAPGKGKHDYGFPTSTAGLQPFAGIALGSATVSPINMASGYATIANGGRFAAPYIIEKVEDDDGRTLYQHKVADEQVIDKEQGADIAADVSYAMQQVVNSGSGTAALALGRPAAGKTGTSTNDDGDVVSAWFSGFTPQLATSVMYVRGKGNGPLDGYLPEFYGGTYPAQTWTSIMEADMDGVDEEDFPEPAYVDGEAPETDHVPTYAPPPQTPQPTRRPSQTQTQKPTQKPTKRPTKPTQQPTSEPPITTSTPEVPTQAPPTTQAPPPTTAPPTTAPPTAPVTPAATPAARTGASARSVFGRWASGF